ncbi:DUF1203 domain-containing protein [Paralimibaculum aggregatum]|uniref:DUF1203 domain-containing protein n=1 Tax=Paralimibaculum aggregatum TaxID=3036245 RepID=A0ABQ6LPN3_9RHOB|nr:DUF1203 domain-containing protein [Limibaculum sp. NKW23]GMG82330.1 DUF1203 domain-containing protein [Limibaculum sp. NKW23]
MSFQIHALPAAQFSGLFALSDEALAARNMRRMVVRAKPGTPCRVSLADAEIGETVILLNHEHQPAASPYRASHAIFVREGAAQAVPSVGEVPEALATRLLSLRLFDAGHMMIGADVVDGAALPGAIDRAFEDAAVAYIHLHNAGPGCFAAAVTRAQG